MRKAALVTVVSYRLQFVSGEVPLTLPLRTGRKTFDVLPRVWIRIDSVEGDVGFGEICFWPEHGSETKEESLAWLQAQNGVLSVIQIPQKLPATAYAVACAVEQLALKSNEMEARLPTGIVRTKTAVLGNLADIPVGKVVKLKIGLGDVALEQRQLRALMGEFRPGQKVRLDANRSLSNEDWAAWLPFLEQHRERVEFFEEPVAWKSQKEAIRLQSDSPVSLALDESLRSLEDIHLWEDAGWDGCYVVKPSILGNPRALTGLEESIQSRLILSSAFESTIGFLHLLCLVERLDCKLLPGLGTIRYLQDLAITEDDGAILWKPSQIVTAMESEWNRLSTF